MKRSLIKMIRVRITKKCIICGACPTYYPEVFKMIGQNQSIKIINNRKFEPFMADICPVRAIKYVRVK